MADFLCVVYFIDEEPPRMCLIPREALTPDHIVQRVGYRIRSGFKNQRTLEPFMIQDETKDG